MTILTFDCATQTGWCAGDGADIPILGTVNMPSAVEPGEFLDFWARWLERQLDEVKPRVVVFEAPILPRETSITTVRKLVGMAGVLEMLLTRRKIEHSECTTSQVKKYLTGDGKAEKPDMMRAAKKCGVMPKNYDEADAFGVWLLGVHYYARQHQPRWDKAMFSGSGLV